MTNSTIIDKIVKAFRMIAGGMAFVADFIAIYLYVTNVNAGASALSNPTGVSVGLAIAIPLIFLLALVLLKVADEQFEAFFIVFGMIYATLASVLLGLATRLFISDYGTDATSQITPFPNIPVLRMINLNEEVLLLTLEYIVLALLITWFAWIVIRRSNIDARLVAIPYVLVSFYQIAVILQAYATSVNATPVVWIFLLLEIGIIAIFFGRARSRSRHQ